MNDPGIVIVGGGMAGYTLAREFRKLDATTPVTMVTADDGAVYSKPMLSNALIQHKAPDALIQKDAARAATDLDITVRVETHVEAIDRASKHLALRGGSELAYDKLILAVGAQPRPYALNEGDAAAIQSVNSLTDYRRWRLGMIEGSRILIMGAGLIGVEFANDLAAAGYRVTIVDPTPWPLGRLLPEQAGQALREALEEAGIAFHLGRTVNAITPIEGAWRARLDDGTTVEFDRALSAIGLVPQTGLAAAADLNTAMGILVDDMLATNDPDIFAIGDCAETEAGMLPYVLPLMAEARTLARTLAGNPTRLHLPALPVVVKTPALPVAICPPKPGMKGDWLVTGGDRDIRAVFRAPDGMELGFALTGGETTARQSLARAMPDLMAA
jgi:rubredoxin-NAD+ reductase